MNFDIYTNGKNPVATLSNEKQAREARPLNPNARFKVVNRETGEILVNRFPPKKERRKKS